jgi:hypothetical protein
MMRVGSSGGVCPVPETVPPKTSKLQATIRLLLAATTTPNAAFPMRRTICFIVIFSL